MKKKLLVICGSTATGKTALGVKLAKKLNGEIVSADSRQVYKGMDISTGKDIPVQNSKLKTQNSKLKIKNKNYKIGYYLFSKIPVWLLDVAEPDQEFSVSHWVKFAQKVIQDIWKRKKLAIIVGGTGFWIKALVDGVDSVGIPPDWKMRRKLRDLDIKKLRRILGKLDPERLQRMNKSDRNNPRRLIRAIEVGKLKIVNSMKIVNCKLKINSLLIIGLKASNRFLYHRIDKRVEKRIKQGAQKEIETLIKKGYSWELPSMSATGYKEWQPFFRSEATFDAVIQRWKYNEHAYARRQITWFKKNKEIKWFDIEKTSWQTKVEKLVTNWYIKNNGKS